MGPDLLFFGPRLWAQGPQGQTLPNQMFFHFFLIPQASFKQAGWLGLAGWAGWLGWLAGLAGWVGWLAGLAGWLGWLGWLAGLLAGLIDWTELLS